MYPRTRITTQPSFYCTYGGSSGGGDHDNGNCNVAGDDDRACGLQACIAFLAHQYFGVSLPRRGAHDGTEK